MSSVGDMLKWMMSPSGKKEAPKVGSGMAFDAAAILNSRPYQLHVAMAQANGETPMTPEEFWRYTQEQQGGGTQQMPMMRN